MNLSKCLLKHRDLLADFEHDDVRHMAAAYRAKGMTPADAEIKAVSDKIREITTDRNRAHKDIIEQYKALDPEGHKEIFEQPEEKVPPKPAATPKPADAIPAKVAVPEKVEAKPAPKSAEKPAEEAEKPLPKSDILFSRKEDLPDPFYSALNRSVGEMKGAPKTADAKAWKQWLDGAMRRGEFKQEERDWMDVDGFLDSAKKPITRQELQDFVRQNQVKLEERRLSNDDRPSEDILKEAGFAKHGHEEDAWYTDASGEQYSFDELPEEVQNALNGINESGDEPPKFAGYQTAGGSNYQEHLLKLPIKEPSRATRLRELRARYNSPDQDRPLNEAEMLEARDLSAAEQRGEFKMEQHPSEAKHFVSSHFPEDHNIVAHTRTNDRVGPNGEKILHIEEIQSDCGQKARKEGVKAPPRPVGDPETYQVAQDEHQWHVTDPESGRTVSPGKGTVSDEEDARAYAKRYFDGLAKDEGGREYRKVPDAPFIKNTASWAALAFKRMLRKAAEEGYQKLTWTTGDTQNERYDLSKKINEIHYSGTNLKAYDHDGKVVLSQTGVKPADLPDYIGKEAAEKLMNQEPQGTLRSLTGQDLKMGGDPMKAFYDRMLPNEVNRYVKKWGAKVGESEIPTTISKSSYLDDLAARSGEPREPESTVKVHSLDINDAMREAALQGQPLFSRKDDPKTKTPEFKKFFEGSKVVDADGQPLVVYHGSPDARFAQPGGEGIFKTLKDRYGLNEDRRAFFFAADPRAAKTYADEHRAFDYQNAEGGVVPAYVSIKNPLEINAKGGHWRGTDAMIDKAIADGHDGAIIKNVRDDYSSQKKEHGQSTTVYVAFKPEQIKSATHNRGTFDPNDADISHSRKEPQYPLAPPGTRYEESQHEPEMRSPDDFIKSVRPLKIDDVSRDNIDSLKNHIQSGGKLDPLHIYADGKEDGRHRAVAAKELGIKQVPVIDERPAVDFSRSTTTLDNQTKQLAAGIDMNNDEQLRAVGRGSIGHAFAVKQKVEIQTERALNDWRNHFDKMMSAGQKGIDTIRKAVHEWETGKPQSNPVLTPFFDAQKKAFDQRIDEIRKGGRLVGFLDNYWPHLYKDPKKAKDWINDQMSKAPLEGGKGWTKERFYQTLEGARQAGLETISENPADMAQAHLGQLDKYLALHQIKTDLDDRGLTVKDNPDALRKPEGWDTVRDPAFQGKLLPDVVAKDLNTILGPSLNASATFRGFRKVENALVSAALGLSGFHATMTTGDTIASHIGDGIQRAADGDISGAMKSLGAALVSPVISPIKGAAYKKLSIGETPTGLFTGMLGMNKPADAHTAALLRMLEQGGHQVSMSPTELNDSLTKLNRLRHQAQYKLIPELLKATGRSLASGKIRDAATHAAEAAHIPWEAAHAIMENITPLIHKHLVPAQKMTAKMLGLKFELDALADKLGKQRGDYAGIEKELNIDAQRQIAGRVVRQVDDRLGQQNYRNLYMNRYARDVMQAALMSPGWQIGTLRTIGGGLADVRKLGTGGDTIHGNLDLTGRISNAKMNRLTSRTAYLIGLHALVGGIAAGTTYALTGTTPQDIRDFYTIRTGRKNDDGTDERLSFPSYLKDEIELVHGGNIPKNMWNMTMNKLNPAFRVISDLSQNKDFYGNHIYDPDADTSVQARQIGEHLASTLIPFSVSGAHKSAEAGSSVGTIAANTMGINPAPGYMTATPFFDYLKSHAQDHGHEALNPDEAAHKQDFYRALSAIREGKEPDVSMLTDKEQNKLDRYAETSAPEAKFSRLTLPEKVKAWENATDEERTQYNLQDHIFTSGLNGELAELPEDEQDAMQGKIDEIGNWTPKGQTQQAATEQP